MDDFTCAVCSEVYEISVREPVALPKCGHTFCRLCLINLQSKALLFKCPTCRALHTGTLISSMPSLFVVLSILDKQMKEKGTLNICKIHEDPIRLWCRSCKEELCGQCLYETHMGPDGHDIVKINIAIEEMKDSIKERATQIKEFIESEKYHVEEALYNVAIQIGALFDKSQTLKSQAKRVEDILKISLATNQVRSVIKNLNIMEELLRASIARPVSKDTASKRETPLQNGSEKCDTIFSDTNSVLGHSIIYEEKVLAKTRQNSLSDCCENNSESSQDEEEEDFQDTEDKDSEHQGEDSIFALLPNVSEWPLTTLIQRRKHWPIINWYQFLKEVPMIQLLVPPENPEVYLELSAHGKILGRLHIKLWGYLRRAQNFLSLCLGTFGPSYKGSKFTHVARKGKPGERLIGGLYEHEGTSTGYPMMDGLEWRGEYTGQMRAGMIGGSRGRQPKFNSCFCISTRDYPKGKYYCPFGEVVSGLEVAQEAVLVEPIDEVTISDVGLIIPKHYL